MKRTLLVAALAIVAMQASVLVAQRRAKFDAVSATAANAPREWTQWRGPARDGKSTETGLLTSWPEAGPKLAWQIKGLGKGYSSIVISDGRLFTMGRRGRKEYLIALREKDGKELWATPVGEADHSNCTPTVDGNLVFALGLKGDLICADVRTGKTIWKKNFRNDFGGQMMSGWGYSESPLVDGDKLICTPGSASAMMAALDKKTGRTLWTTNRPNEDVLGKRGKNGAGYSSIVISNAVGVRQYVQLTGKGVISVRASDGKLLWNYNRIANGVANIPTPVIKDDHVFCSSGYGTGAALLKVEKSGSGLEAKEVYFLKANVMQNHHGGMILIGDHIYCGHGHNKGLPLCIELKTGKVAWRPGRGAGEGSAAIIYADGHLYFRYQDATMALIGATPEGYYLKGQFKIAVKNGASWPHPAIANGKLYLRDQKDLLCYDIGEKK